MGDLFKPNLATDIEDLRILNGGAGVPVRYPKIASMKLDGIRAITVEGDALSRSRKPIANRYIRAALREWQHLDGEIILGNPSDEGVYHRTQSVVNSHEHEDQADFKFYIFDHLADMSLTFTQRQERLRAATMPPFGLILPQYEIASDEQLQTMFDQALKEGFEGLILRNGRSMYKFGRSTAKSQGMLKVKPFVDGECIIDGVYPAMHNTNEAQINELGRTFRATDAEGLVPMEMVGGFNVHDAVTGVAFECGAGILTHEQRRYLWTIRHTLTGKQFTYRSMAYGVKVTTGVPRSPRFRFKGWREAWDL